MRKVVGWEEASNKDFGTPSKWETRQELDDVISEAFVKSVMQKYS